MHEQKLDVLGVVDQESLVAGGHQMTGLLVAAVTNLKSVSTDSYQQRDRCQDRYQDQNRVIRTYLGHGQVALEAAADTVVDTLGLAPC